MNANANERFEVCTDLVLKINMSDSHDTDADEFTEVTDGVFSLSYDTVPRYTIRDYVDGDRAVALSERLCIRMKMILISGNMIQKRILSAAQKCIPLRCAFMHGDEMLFCGNMLAAVKGIDSGSIYGMTADIEFIKGGE